MKEEVKHEIFYKKRRSCSAQYAKYLPPQSYQSTIANCASPRQSSRWCVYVCDHIAAKSQKGKEKKLFTFSVRIRRDQMGNAGVMKKNTSLPILLQSPWCTMKIFSHTRKFKSSSSTKNISFLLSISPLCGSSRENALYTSSHQTPQASTSPF